MRYDNNDFFGNTHRESLAKSCLLLLQLTDVQQSTVATLAGLAAAHSHSAQLQDSLDAELQRLQQQREEQAAVIPGLLAECSAAKAAKEHCAAECQVYCTLLLLST